MIRALVFLALLLLPGVARAVEADMYCVTAIASNGKLDWEPVGGAAACLPGFTATTTPAYTTPAGTNQYALTLATAKTLTVPTGAKVATVTVEGQPIRCTTDGTTTPTSTVGSVFPVGAVFSVYQTALASLSCIQTASAATVDVEYFK